MNSAVGLQLSKIMVTMAFLLLEAAKIARSSQDF